MEVERDEFVEERSTLPGETSSGAEIASLKQACKRVLMPPFLFCYFDSCV